ncbi:MAG: hypothetical protein QXI16_06905, partial [Sulfolobaceae archaeon]
MPGVRSGDSFTQNYFLRLYYAKEGLKLWLPYEFLGLPFLGLLHAGLLYPFNLGYFFIPPIWMFTLNEILHPALASFFTFIYARYNGISTLPSFMAGIIFGFSGFIAAHRGHTSMINAATWFPLLLYFYEKIRRELQLKHSAVASIIVALQVFAGHYQVSVYTYLALGLFSIVALPTIEKGKRFYFILLVSLPIFFGSIIALPQLIATEELGNLTFRPNSYDFFIQYSFPFFMLPQLFFPFIFGEGYGGNYWGAWNLTEMAGFIGTFPLIVALWTAINLWKQNFPARFLTILLSMSFLLALGGYNPIYRIMHIIPVYNLFRCPARHWMEFDFAASVLFSIGLHFILGKTNGIKKQKEIFVITILTLGLMLTGFWIVRSSLENLYYHKIITSSGYSTLTQVLKLTNPAIYIPFTFLGLYSVWSYLFSYSHQVNEIVVSHSLNSYCRDSKCSAGYYRNTILILILTGIILAEAFSFGGFHNKHCISSGIIEKVLKSGYMDYIKNNTSHERVVFITNHTLPLYNVPLKIHTLGGYDPLMPKPLYDILNMLPNGVSPRWSFLLNNNHLLSILNVKYILISKSDENKYKISSIKIQKPILQKVTLGEWNFISSRILQDSELFLVSPDGKQVSMIHQPIVLKPNTYYLMKLEARSMEKRPNHILSFDLYGQDYDSYEQELDVDPQNISKTFRSFSKVIYTGNNIPFPVNIRIFTFSTRPIIVRNVKLKEIDSYGPPALKNNLAENTHIYEEVSESNDMIVYENKNYLFRIFPVTKLEVADTIEEVRKKFELFEFNPAETALISKNDLDKIGRTTFSRGEVHIKEYDADHVTAVADFPEGPGFLVLSDQYFPGWKAFIDGKETPIYQVNGLLRGITTPK